MPMSDYVRSLRERVGTMQLEMPTASVIVFDETRRILMVRHVEGNEWTTPGGLIEPEETPADAAVREAWEETGLAVDLVRIIGVFGGKPCTSTYANGDRIAWVSTVFEARVVGGTARHDDEETLEVRFLHADELRRLPRKPHVDMFVDAAMKRGEAAVFQPATWRPPIATR
jgi:8-oxo-dGTP pyrophosphatase MutT (NUDIX family)